MPVQWQKKRVSLNYSTYESQFPGFQQVILEPPLAFDQGEGQWRVFADKLDGERIVVATDERHIKGVKHAQKWSERILQEINLGELL